MASNNWVKTGGKWCDFVHQDVEILEQRAYPDDRLPDMIGYQVVGRKCTAAIDCNMLGVPCKWAFTNPNSDQFDVA